MFTGIVEEIGTVQAVRRSGSGYALTVSCRTVVEDTRLGDSIAVNGVCLTVTDFHDSGFTVGLSPETRRRTSLMDLKSGSPVNLERSLTPTSRIGGHFVQGHVDGTGTLTRVRRDADALWVTVQAPADVMRYIVPKGYVALDGVSLTVVDVGTDWFTVQLVAYTQQQITLPQQPTGSQVNIEVDVLGKYVEKLLTGRSGPAEGGITMDFLQDNGYA